MDSHRQFWNERQQALRQALAHPDEFDRAIDLFMGQHAMVHTTAMSQSGVWSFQDEVLQGVSEAAARRIPPGGEHSLAWLTWHITRIEDATMGVLAAGSPQILESGRWQPRLNTDFRHTGNVMTTEDVARLSREIDLDALLAYRLAVGRRTREVIRQLAPEELRRRVDSARLQHLADDGTVAPGAGDLLAYWGGLTIAGLLLMPPTRHPFIHLNEALRIKSKIARE